MKQGNRATAQKLKRKTARVEFSVADYPELEEDTFWLLREMDGVERDAYEIAGIREEEVKETNGKKPPTFRIKRTVDLHFMRPRLVSLCLVDETGNRIYADDEVHQCAADFPSSALQKLFEAAQKLNALNEEPEEAAKNSNADHSDTSASASPLH